MERIYLVNIQMSTEGIELCVEVLEHVDDHHGRGSGTNGGEPYNITEEHCHVLVRLRLDRLSCVLSQLNL